MRCVGPVAGMTNTGPILAADGTPFVNINPAANTQGSAVPAEAFNVLLKELTHLVEYSGQTPSANDGDLQQVRKAVQGLIDASVSPDYKAPCRVATTATITLSGLQTIDGVALVAGDRVLVKDQTVGSANGIYVAATGGWSRAADAVTDKIKSGALVPVIAGTTGAGSLWIVATDGPITVGTTAITFARVSGDGLPVGSIIEHSGPAAPAGYLIANGAAVARAAYTQLDATMYVGDGLNASAPAYYRCTDSSNPTSTRATGGAYLVLPDYRGVVRRGLDLGRGLDPDSATRVVNSYQADELKSHTHTTNAGGQQLLAGGNNGATNWVNGQQSGATGNAETRGKNTAVLVCIKAFAAATNQGLIDITALANEVAGKVALASVTGANQLLATSGYQKLPGGLILQWGATSVPGAYGTAAVTFPIAFPTACYGSLITSISRGQYGSGVRDVTTTGMTILNGSDSSGLIFQWLAYGK